MRALQHARTQTSVLTHTPLATYLSAPTAQESEGYAKVLTVLNNFGASALSDESAPDVVTTLQSLIGAFDLDPNRVFDLVLDRRARLRAHTHTCVAKRVREAHRCGRGSGRGEEESMLL
jgi:hypothetical protein